MKWIRFLHNDRPAYGIVQQDTVAVTDLSWDEVLAGARPRVVGTVERRTVQLLNPVHKPGKIVAIGLNYMDHCRETNTPPPPRPLVFTKFTTSANDPYADIVWARSLTNEVDYEAELAVVIGRTCRRVSEADALACVGGYTAANDVSARDLQMGDGQWIRGKSLDTFCPLGPAFVTADEIGDPQRLRIRCLVNGEVKQDSNTDQMIFPVAQLVAFCSQAFTLEAGDVILTGTPHGVALGRKPPVYLADGDVVTVEIEKIGRLENRCRVVD